MTRVETATYALLASAFVLGALVMHTAMSNDAGSIGAERAALLSQLPFESTASADFVVTKNIYTVLSAQGISNEDFLYVLDNRNQRLMCYRHDPSGRIELFASINVAENVQRAMQTAGGGGGGGGRTGR